MTLSEYLLSLKGKKIAVLGYGISNRPLVKLLADAVFAKQGPADEERVLEIHLVLLVISVIGELRIAGC